MAHISGEELFEAAVGATRTDAFFQFNRERTVTIHDQPVEIHQSKSPADESELAAFQTLGAAAFATSQWFDEVSLRAPQADDKTPAFLGATYPTNFFPGVRHNLVGLDDKPAGYADNFGDRQRVGDGPWLYRLYDPETQTARTIKSNEPEEMQQYTEHFNWYLAQLSTDPTISYCMLRHFTREHPKVPGLQISEIAVLRAIRDSSRATGEVPSARILAGNKKLSYAVTVTADDSLPPSCEIYGNRSFNDYAGDRPVPPAVLSTLMKELIQLSG